MFVLHIDIEEQTRLLGTEGRKFFRDFTKQVLFDTGEYFHDRLLERRFEPGAAVKYHHEPRNLVYKQNIKPEKGVGEGKTADLQLKGKSRRWILAFRKITGTHKRVIVRMTAPVYFKRPFVGTYTDFWGRQKQITRQPDKIEELLRNNDQDSEELARYARKRWRHYLAKPAVRKFIRLL